MSTEKITEANRPTRASTGFTVLEMAISLAIAGVALVALLQAFSITLTLAGHADRLAEATLLARSKLNEISGIDPVSLGSSSGAGLHGLIWRAEVSPVPAYPRIDAIGRELVSVTVSVFRSNEAAQGPIVELKSFALSAAQ